jgi:hypothetical protein
MNDDLVLLVGRAASTEYSKIKHLRISSTEGWVMIAKEREDR